MARYKFYVSCTFDTELQPEKQSDEVRNFVIANCPQNFNLRQNEFCGMTDCWTCWYKALEEGVINGCKSVHVERMD